MIITPKQNVTYQSVFPYLLPWHINFELLWDGILQYNNYTAVHDVDIHVIVVSSEILYTYLALTKLSLDILASISAVSINNMDCLSKIVDMAWTREREERKKRFSRCSESKLGSKKNNNNNSNDIHICMHLYCTWYLSTRSALAAHFTNAKRRTNCWRVRLANCTISIFLQKIIKK